MGHIFYDKTPGWRDVIPLESSVCFSFKKSMQYARQFQRFAGAIVPDDVYYDATYKVVNAYLPVDVDLSACSQVGWTAKRDDDTTPTDPLNLEVFLVMTFLDHVPISRPQRIQQVDKAGDLERAHILFPGSWALLVWEKAVCLWHKNKQLLRTNPLYPQGLIHARHENLSDVFSVFLTV